MGTINLECTFTERPGLEIQIPLKDFLFKADSIFLAASLQQGHRFFNPFI